MTTWAKISLITIALLLGATAAQQASAKEPPADLCSLLPASQITTITGQPYDAAQKTVAPRPYANTVEGSDCTYKKSKGSGAILFRAYADPSPSDAAGLFAKLGLFYSPQTPVAGVGDKAYLDPRHGLHVLKGRVRLFISMDSFDEKQAKALGSYVAGQL